MRRRKAIADETRLKERRGQGTYSDYTPWILVHEFSSHGFSSRVYGWKTKRIHHFFSLLELLYFYTLEWSPIISDVREQYPLLPLDETVAIAQSLGIKHPIDPMTREPKVMTTDFYLSVLRGIGVCHQARTIKYAQDLLNRRVIEKFEIERVYFQNRNINWAIITERDIPLVVARNVEILHPYFHAESLHPLSKKEIHYISKELTKAVIEKTNSLSDIAADCDRRLDLTAGTSLKLAWYLIAQRQWEVDITKPIEPCKRLMLYGHQLDKIKLKFA